MSRRHLDIPRKLCSCHGEPMDRSQGSKGGWKCAVKRRARYKPQPRKAKVCPYCQRTFVPPYSRTQYCSVECRKRNRADLIRERHASNPSVYRARWRNRKPSRRVLRERERHLTAADRRALLASRTYCPECRSRMTDEPGPRQKQLDHIVPVAVGGTDTHGNVRVPCRTCNLARPKDGSDVTQATLWAPLPKVLEARGEF